MTDFDILLKYIYKHRNLSTLACYKTLELSIIYNSQDMEITYMPDNGWINWETVV